MGSEDEESVIAKEDIKRAEDASPTSSPSHKEIETVQKLAEETSESKGRSRSAGQTSSSSTILEEPRPPLPPRPTNLSLIQEGKYSPGSTLHVPKRSLRPGLQSNATVALSRPDIHTQSHQDEGGEITVSSPQATPPTKSLGFGNLKRSKGLASSEDGDTSSFKSYAPTLEVGGDVESLLGEVPAASQVSPTWKLLSAQVGALSPFDSTTFEDDELTANFYREFDEIQAVGSQADDSGKVNLIFAKQ